MNDRLTSNQTGAKLLIDIQLASTLKAPEAELINHWAELAASHYLQRCTEDQELAIRIVDPDESQQLNFQYRQKNKPTNVLSFPFEAIPGVSFPLLGDLIICAPIVLAEAKAQDKILESHWAHMIIHGVLHLLGYDHIEAKKAEKMENLEVKLLAKLGYANPYL